MTSTRHDRLIVAETAVVVVDMQERLMAVMPESARLADRARRLVDGARLLGLPVVFTEQAPAKLGPTVSPLRERIERPPVEKVSFSCCDVAPFREMIRSLGRPTLILAGIEAHVCIWQTARDLLQEGYRVEVVADAVASRDPSHRDLALVRLRDAGAGIACVEMVLFDLLRAAEGTVFREISKLVR
ncbi:MAG: isochorismatase family protein [Kiritimatiellae bacterium]|nr:isochorismatase family protein [Kiritimatiellia bacterium]